jgi:RNA polymerase sigma-70 factor (ECF subfamily)
VDPAESSAAEDRLGELYRLHAGWLKARLRRLVGAEADDLVQETYLRIARYQRAGDIPHPRALLLRIAVNLDLDARRRARRREAATAAACPDEGQDAPRQAQAVLLKQVILSLPEPLREVFVLSRFGGLTYEQIGERLGLSVKTVEWRMSKALAHCAAQLQL